MCWRQCFQNFSSLNGKARASGTLSCWRLLSGSWGSTCITSASGFSCRPFQFLLQSECFPLTVKGMHFHLERPNESKKLLSHPFTIRPKMQVWFEKTKMSLSKSRNVYYSYILILGLYIQILNRYINIYLKFSRFNYVLISEQNPKRNLATIFYPILILSEWLRLKVF